MKSSPRLGWIHVLSAIAVVGIILAGIFPAVNPPEPGHESKLQAQNDVFQIATAVNAFVVEYGVYPGTNGVVSGDLLAALVGNNNLLNPRKLVFLEVTSARKGKSGVTNGIFVDPWAGPYQIAMLTGTNLAVTAGTNGLLVNKNVAVWTDPSLGKDGKSLNEKERQRRYVTSWQ